MKLSLCMIVKNEQDTLACCLDSVVGLFDEIIIVDTGSSDNTKQIAQNYTDKIYDFEWVNDFSRARNYAFSLATGDYIMWLDADDVVPQTSLEKLMSLKEKLDGSKDCYMLKYAIAFNNQGNPTFLYYREIIVKNDGTFFWVDPVHEVITPHGNIEYSDIVIYHKKQKETPKRRNLDIYEEQLKQGKGLSARQKFYYARELYYNQMYTEAIKELNDYLTNHNGWLENKIEACLTLSRCHMATHNISDALSVLFYSFALDTPRAEVLCEIANIYIFIKDYKKVLYWANLATKTKINVSSGAFVNPECYNVTPHLQLCIAHFYLNEINKSIKHNNKVLSFDPTNPSALINKQLFEQLKTAKDKPK